MRSRRPTNRNIGGWSPSAAAVLDVRACGRAPARREGRAAAGHRPLEPELAVLVDREAAGRAERVDVPRAALEQPAPAPELRRPAVVRETAQALAPDAGLAVVPPQHVGGADQPVLVRGVELDARRRSGGHRARRPARRCGSGRRRAPRSSRSIARRWTTGRPSWWVRSGESRPSAAAQRVDADAVRLGRCARHRTSPRSSAPVGVHVVDHVDAVTGAHQRLRHVTDQHGVAAEVVGRIEGGDEDEAEHAWRRRRAVRPSIAASRAPLAAGATTRRRRRPRRPAGGPDGRATRRARTRRPAWPRRRRPGRDWPRAMRRRRRSPPPPTTTRPAIASTGSDATATRAGAASTAAARCDERRLRSVGSSPSSRMSADQGSARSYRSVRSTERKCPTFEVRHLELGIETQAPRRSAAVAGRARCPRSAAWRSGRRRIHRPRGTPRAAPRRSRPRTWRRRAAPADG